MFSIPSPLHPAVVHFPIVLIILGTLVAVAAAITRRWNLPVLAAILLSLGTIGTLVALKTGERDGEAVEEQASMEQLLDQHEEWAERTLTAASIAAGLAVASVLLGRRPLPARLFSAFAAAGAVAAFVCVAETGHHGGQLVYQQGAGVITSANATSAANKPLAEPVKKHRSDRDDD